MDAALAADDVRRMAAQARVTPFAVLLAAFAAVLRIRTGGDDLVVCTQLANRGRPELARLMGCLTTTVPLRVDASGGRSFAALASSSQRALVMAYRYGNVDFGRVLNACGPAPGPLSTPTILFQMIPRGPARARPVPALLADVARPGGGLPVDLHIGVSLDGGQVRCEADFNNSVYRSDTVAGLLGELSRVLRAALSSMAASVSSVCERAAQDRGGSGAMVTGHG